jgi:hypothetical protein
MEQLYRKLEKLEAGDEFIFLDRLGKSDLACEVGSECVIVLEQTSCFKFRVTREHAPEGPHEAVFLGAERLEMTCESDALPRHEVAL